MSSGPDAAWLQSCAPNAMHQSTNILPGGSMCSVPFKPGASPEATPLQVIEYVGLRSRMDRHPVSRQVPIALSRIPRLWLLLR
jgi:hypothetical protein